MNSEQLSDLVVDALEDIKAKDIVKLDVRDMTTVTDYMVVASGTSTRHVQALVDNVIEKASKAGHKPIGVDCRTRWYMSCCQECVSSITWKNSGRCGRPETLPRRNGKAYPVRHPGEFRRAHTAVSSRRASAGLGR
jgi:ribosome silencing factor RsfS/YbeB/iojap